ncbi:MAG: bifunctional aspartate kinase/homoserine dehydrogenase I [Bacteroidetes bacterium]|nr:bifunctional aspartate kinase/homoserine dehydrogenase I [Bacteroidota bacterium]MBU1371491.1 bifunctional aspartate kinase/homoserine dehydrogenase I [Bacteroidota bacterium]MBU1485721.1 bifunctional aspartate kinase/homoserine dehydrogenase I [Bacteroidota bacterium]MBU1759397.1 bifunctional aspartate kinase/homoserine dehydrogenase I [Bacteroidota bacterium]MBU2047148.1 bifunctional aspartate kinase/homoserine dehydrogenase I [Bacteroidota bacterium]
MKILKFGGTSVGSVEALKALMGVIKRELDQKEPVIIVVSAMAGVTNQLLKMAEDAVEGSDYMPSLTDLEKRHFVVVKELVPLQQQNQVLTKLKLYFQELEDILQGITALQELSAKTKDVVLSFGEKSSAFMISRILRTIHLQTEFLDTTSVIKTDSSFGNAKVDIGQTNLLVQDFFAHNSENLVVATGFIASNAESKITTLGRGGSDYTAAIFGAALNVSQIEIWTDVNGMMTADPRRVKKAFSMEELSYTEAMELSFFGAKVIYPPTMIPAFLKKIPIVIKNTFDPEFAGTFIKHDLKPSNTIIRGISSVDRISIINIEGSGMVGKAGFSGRLFSLLSREQVNVILITQSSSEHSITFAVNPDEVLKAKILIEQEFELELHAGKLEPVKIETNLSILAIVGENMKKTPGISGKLFNALGRNGVNVVAIAQGSSEYNISVIIYNEDLSKALNAVHDAFFAELQKTLNVFVVGVGNIGTELLSQIKGHKEFLAKNNLINIKILGLTNTKKMLIDVDGIDLGNWKELLNASEEEANLEEFIQQMKKLNLPNCVFIDNTASPYPSQFYKEAFEANISVVTCNKIANSGEYAQFAELKNTAQKHGVDFYYETNVGAGLPIIKTLNDLIVSGDKISKIEAILSGTISFIFNNFKGDANFHDVVKLAQEKGFTEPDPRDDLGGVDFMRKMLILARNTGIEMEANDVKLGEIIPESCAKAPSVADFYQELKSSNDYFEQVKKDAEKAGKVLRYIGKLENGKVEISMQAVGADHPFYALSGSDNIIAFTTDRYNETQMVVKGPGAGAAVTAAGVFADLVKVGASKA